jgi:hypothetical protein
LITKKINCHQNTLATKMPKTSLDTFALIRCYNGL